MRRGLIGVAAGLRRVARAVRAPALGSTVNYPGMEHLHFAAGPYRVTPGANLILLDYNHVPKPDQDGYMVRMQPNLRYALPDGKCCGTVPPVDVIHLHHGVWLSNGTAGEGEGNGYGDAFYPVHGLRRGEDRLPVPAGLRVPDRGQGSVGPQLHDPQPDRRTRRRSTSTTTSTSSPPPRRRRPASPRCTRSGWTSRPTISTRCSTSSATAGSTASSPSRTWPSIPSATPRAPHRSTSSRVDHPGVLVATAGHVHPGGLYDTLDLIRPGATPSGGAIARQPSPTPSGCSGPSPTTGTSAGRSRGTCR